MNDPFEILNGNATSHEPVSLKDRVRGLRLGDQLQGVKTRGTSTSWLPWLLCIVMAACWASVGFRWYRATDGRFSTNKAEAVTAQNVGTPSNASNKLSIGEVVLERKGYIIPAHQISISPIGVEGRIVDLRIIEGQECKEGEVLAVLDATLYQAQLDEALKQEAATQARYLESQENLQFEIHQAKSELAQSQAQLEEAKVLHDNARRTASGATSKEDTDQKAKKYAAALANLEVQKAKLSQVNGKSRLQRIEALHRDWEAAKARVRTAEWRLDNCQIKAPITGIILSKKAEKFNLINPVVGGVSTSLCEMADLSDLEIELEVEERDIAKVEIGMQCTIKTDAYPNRSYEGYVRRIMPVGNRGKGILPVRIKILVPKDEKQGFYLKPEMNSLVSIHNNKSRYWSTAATISEYFGSGVAP